MKVLNLTQHDLTPDQLTAGAVEPDAKTKEAVKSLLTFHELPSPKVIKDRAWAIASIARSIGATHALIGGAPFLMGALERGLLSVGICPVYAFSRRESIESVGPDGAVTKTSVFKHAGWVHTE